MTGIKFDQDKFASCCHTGISIPNVIWENENDPNEAYCVRSVRCWKCGTEYEIEDYFSSILRLADEEKNPIGIRHKGILYYFGHGGLVRDIPKALNCFIEALDQGDLGAVYPIICFDNDRTLPFDELISKITDIPNSEAYLAFAKAAAGLLAPELDNPDYDPYEEAKKALSLGVTDVQIFLPLLAARIESQDPSSPVVLCFKHIVELIDSGNPSAPGLIPVLEMNGGNYPFTKKQYESIFKISQDYHDATLPILVATGYLTGRYGIQPDASKFQSWITIAKSVCESVNKEADELVESKSGNEQDEQGPVELPKNMLPLSPSFVEAVSMIYNAIRDYAPLKSLFDNTKNEVLNEQYDDGTENKEESTSEEKKSEPSENETEEEKQVRELRERMEVLSEVGAKQQQGMSKRLEASASRSTLIHRELSNLPEEMTLYKPENDEAGRFALFVLSSFFNAELDLSNPFGASFKTMILIPPHVLGSILADDDAFTLKKVCDLIDESILPYSVEPKSATVAWYLFKNGLKLAGREVDERRAESIYVITQVATSVAATSAGTISLLFASKTLQEEPARVQYCTNLANSLCDTSVFSPEAFFLEQIANNRFSEGANELDLINDMAAIEGLKAVTKNSLLMQAAQRREQLTSNAKELRKLIFEDMAGAMQIISSLVSQQNAVAKEGACFSDDFDARRMEILKETLKQTAVARFFAELTRCRGRGLYGELDPTYNQYVCVSTSLIALPEEERAISNLRIVGRNSLRLKQIETVVNGRVAERDALASKLEELQAAKPSEETSSSTSKESEETEAPADIEEDQVESDEIKELREKVEKMNKELEAAKTGVKNVAYGVELKQNELKEMGAKFILTRLAETELFCLKLIGQYLNQQKDNKTSDDSRFEAFYALARSKMPENMLSDADIRTMYDNRPKDEGEVQSNENQGEGKTNEEDISSMRDVTFVSREMFENVLANLASLYINNSPVHFVRPEDRSASSARAPFWGMDAYSPEEANVLRAAIATTISENEYAAACPITNDENAMKLVAIAQNYICDLVEKGVLANTAEKVNNSRYPLSIILLDQCRIVPLREQIFSAARNYAINIFTALTTIQRVTPGSTQIVSSQASEAANSMTTLIAVLAEEIWNPRVLVTAAETIRLLRPQQTALYERFILGAALMGEMSARQEIISQFISGIRENLPDLNPKALASYKRLEVWLESFKELVQPQSLPIIEGAAEIAKTNAASQSGKNHNVETEAKLIDRIRQADPELAKEAENEVKKSPESFDAKSVSSRVATALNNGTKKTTSKPSAKSTKKSGTGKKSLLSKLSKSKAFTQEDVEDEEEDYEDDRDEEEEEKQSVGWASSIKSYVVGGLAVAASLAIGYYFRSSLGFSGDSNNAPRKRSRRRRNL